MLLLPIFLQAGLYDEASKTGESSNTITLDGTASPTLSASDISSEAFSELADNSDAEANAGNLIINTNSLSIANGANLSVSNATTGNGNGGGIQINATENISVDGETILLNEDEERTVSSGIFASISSETIGSAGNIEINTSQLSITNQAQVNAFTRGQGDAGSIVINVDQFSLADGSINATTEGQGNAGSLTINADEFVHVSGENSFVRAGAFVDSIGNGGDLTIETDRLFVSGGAQISTGTSGQGNAGNLIVNASDFIELSGADNDGRSGLFNNALIEDGDGGNLQVFTQDLIIRDGATINVSNFPSVEGLTEPGTGEAGSLTVEANSLQIKDGGRIDAATQAGNGGNITLDIADNITLQDSSLISARALEDANGGNIKIDTNFIVAFPNGNNDIIANAEQGNGGNITINAESLFGIEERPLNNSTNDINASSEFSLDGSVTINTPDLNSFQGETDLPQNIITPEQTTAQACNRNRGAIARNSFTIKGKGGIPVEPGLPLDSQNILLTDESSNSISTTPQVIETSQGKIQPARGIKVTESGKIVLTAYRTNNSGARIPEIQPNCG